MRAEWRLSYVWVNLETDVPFKLSDAATIIKYRARISKIFAILIGRMIFLEGLSAGHTYLASSERLSNTSYTSTAVPDTAELISEYLQYTREEAHKTSSGPH